MKLLIAFYLSDQVSALASESALSAILMFQ
jgi:hypothetical protein